MEPSKYYYDDYLSALWMTKHFNMEFHGIGNCLHIRPESEHILDPIILLDLCEFSAQTSSCDANCMPIWRPYFGVKSFLPKDRLDGNVYFFQKIVERKGIPFHWPKI